MGTDIEPRGRGRPPKLAKHEEIFDRIEESLKKGNPLAVVASDAGISRRTFYNYLEKGRKARRLHEEEGEQLTQWDDVYIRLANMVENLEAAVQKKLYDRIEDASEKNWTAAAWILERRFPEDWSKEKKIRHQHTGAGGGPIEFTLDVGDEPDEDALTKQEVIEDPDYEVIEG